MRLSRFALAQTPMNGVRRIQRRNLSPGFERAGSSNTGFQDISDSLPDSRFPERVSGYRALKVGGDND